jgi:hypothetical protein
VDHFAFFACYGLCASSFLSFFAPPLLLLLPFFFFAPSLSPSSLRSELFLLVYLFSPGGGLRRRSRGRELAEARSKQSTSPAGCLFPSPPSLLNRALPFLLLSLWESASSLRALCLRRRRLQLFWLKRHFLLLMFLVPHM